MKVFLGIQARTNSSRFPGKIYKKIGPKELIRWSYDAAEEASKFLKQKFNIFSVVKILGPENDQALKDFCRENKLRSEFPRANENDLFVRYNSAFRDPFTHLVRITSDCWAIDPFLIAACIDLMLQQNYDYVSNTIFRTFEEGKDIQACSLKGFGWMMQNQKEQREHPFVEFDLNKKVRDEFERAGLKYANFTNSRFNFLIRGSSIDTEEDLQLANEVYEKEYKNKRVG